MQYITKLNQLEELCEKLKKQDYIALDTEFIRDNNYYPKLCLIQIACQEGLFVLDVLAENFDLDPFIKTLNNKKILKIMHASRQDLEIFYNISGKIPKPIFDTQIAAMVCGFGDNIGYSSLVKELLKKEINKANQVTNWEKRPLSKGQIEYALDDVRNLKDLHDQLNEITDFSGRKSWVKEEEEELVNEDNYKKDYNNVWEKLKPKSKDRRYLGVIKDLVKWREEKAQKRNRPRKFILKDMTILELAYIQPRNMKDLYLVRSFHSNKYFKNEELLKVIKSSLSKKTSLLPKADKQDQELDVNKQLLEMIRLLLKVKSKENKVAEKLLIDKDEIKKLACSKIDKRLRSFKGWRKDIFGGDVMLLRQGKIGFTYKGKEIKIIEL